jgi:Ca-activated chloride channel family protein
MTFEHPWVLLALLLPLYGAVELRRRRRSAPASRWPAMLRVSVAGDRVVPARPRAARSATLLLLAGALTIVALARPQWGSSDEGAYVHTREVVIALDLSRSMLTEDVGASRLELAKTLTAQILDGLQGESVALVVFAGTAFVQVPLGPDYQIIRAFMPNFDADYLPQGGSDYGRMLDAALDGFGSSTDRDRYLFVLSDGESSTAGWESRLEALARRDVHVISIGVGTTEGGFIPDVNAGGYLADAQGDVVRSRLGTATLEALAKRTNGRYVAATALGDAEAVRGLLRETVETGRKGRTRTDAATLATERFAWFLLPAVLLALASLWREFAPRPAARHLRRIARRPAEEPIRRAPAPGSADETSRKASVAAAVVLVLGLATGERVAAHFDSEADFEVREVFDSNPVQRLRAIVAHLGEFGYDAYDLRLMVEESIRYGVDSQRTGATIAEGAIRDAIEATHRGERLDAGIADWKYYRAQLTDVLQSIRPLADERSEAPQSIVDEENDEPVVIGDGTQQTANDSFGLGASSRTDATLGELTPPDDIPIPRGRKPTPPKQVGAVAVRRGSGGASETDAGNPVLGFARELLEEAAQADSPGRLHLMMLDPAAAPPAGGVDW